MLQSISLRNFQSHRKTFIDRLAPGVNVIVGPSDSGKTSVIRALKWIWQNRPVGSSMVRHGKTCCKAKVRLHGMDKVSVTRSKGPGKSNSYFVNARQFEAVQAGVPEEVQKVLDMGEVNFQFQLDPPFMLGLSPGDAAKKLNEVAGLDDIDRVLGKLSRMKRINDDDLRHAVQERDETKEELDKLPDLVAAKKLVDQLTEWQSNIQKWKKQARSLEEARDYINVCQHFISKHQKKAKAWNELDALGHELGRVQIMQKKWRALQEIDRDRDMCLDLIKTWKGRVAELEKEWHRKMPEVCPLCGRGEKE